MPVSTEQQNLYTLLGITRAADAEEVKSAYRRLARKYHPDVNPDPSAANTFAKLNEAYHVLSDPLRRNWYDRTGSTEGVNLVGKDQQTSAESMRKARRAYYQARADRIVNEWMERERHETRVRGKAVYTIVTLFVSTFLVALLKPNMFDSLGLVTRMTLVALFIAGAWHLGRSLKAHFDYYTYQASRRQTKRKTQPQFQRGVAWAFVIGGYLTAFGAGVLIDGLTNISSELFFNPTLEDALLAAFFYPPIAVLIIDTLYRINLRFEDI